MTELQAPDAASVGAIPFDNPAAYLARDRRRALAEGRELPDRVRGAALFADISGFTPLTEALAAELGPQRGAEELTANLNRVFHAVIDELDRFGGEVIYFSGDAITCWLDADDGTRAAACALAMQAAMARVGELVTPGGATVRLAMKIAVAMGPARRFVVGDPEIQLIDVLAGALIDELAAAEGTAESGEIVLARSAIEALGDRVALGDERPDGQGALTAAVLRGLREPVESRAAELEPDVPEELVRKWLLPAVYERLRTGRGEFLAELRPAIPVFVRFSGIDYDADDEAAAKLDDFVRRAQGLLSRLGGNLLQLTLGDKGAYLYAVFGSPHAHEDDAARAAAAAVELRALNGATDVREIQIGITHGRLRSGTYGHDMRRTFVCLGDAVNLAARLMSKARPGEIYVTETVRQQAGDSFVWKRLPDVVVKGKSDPIRAYALTGARARTARRQQRYRLEIVGRDAELARLSDALARSRAGEGSVVGIAAEAGIGKSRLIAEFVRSVRSAGGLVAFGECQAFGTNASYDVWREIWRTLLHVDERKSEAAQRAGLERELAAIDPGLVPRAPLLGPLLGISFPDNELTRSFDAKLRKTSLEGLLIECLGARAAAEPLVLVLEDCHWIDPLGRDLLEALARAAPALRVLLVLAYRPGSELGLTRLPQVVEIELTRLEPDDAEALIRFKLAELFGSGTEPPQALVDLVTSRSEGNPFYVEELLNYIRGQGVDPEDEAAVRSLQLPESLHSLILSRLDAPGEAPRRTLKVASVVGRSFLARALPGIYPDLGSAEDVSRHLDALRALDLVLLDRAEEQAYVFKHVLTQEVTYESMPFAIRAMLHERVGGYIEATEGDAVEHRLDLLAHHYWLSENEDKKREYLVRAGQAAQANYANASAIDYYERVAPLLPDEERADVLLKLGRVLELVGDWPRAEDVEREALALAEHLQDDGSRAWCQVALAEVARKQGRYEEAAGLLDTAVLSFEAAGDEAGVGQVHHLAGTLAAQQGDYDAAVASYESSLTIRERLGDGAGMASLLSNLGVVAEYRGDNDASRAYHDRALDVRTDLGDRWAIGVSQTNLGMIAVLQHRFDEARTRFEEAMRLNREVGDAWMVAISHNNLGNATRGLGEYDAARAHYAESLRAYRDYDDKWAAAFLLEDIAMLAALVGEPARALELVGAADRLREEIGTPRSPALAESLDEALRAAREYLGDEAEAAGRRGRELVTSAAIDLAVAFCDARPELL
jgi:class 3 adenylate cyclase/tetratricopeptide (TPR) repeat protein